jgi:uncharacterized protein YjbJ (UPF0337 family)
MDDKQKQDAKQGEVEEPSATEEVEERVEAEMKLIEGRAREAVGQGMQDERIEREGRKLREEGQRELDEQREG